MNKKRKPPYAMFILALLFFFLIAYFMSGLFLEERITIVSLEETLNNIFTHPFVNYWNEKTMPCMALGGLAWIYFVSWYLYHNRDFRFGSEHGTAKWEDPVHICKELRDKEPQKNRIISANVEYSLDALPNNNMLVVGSPGTGKTAFLLTPNLLRMAASYVFLDVKGDLLYNYGSYLKENGYQIKVLNLKDKSKSDGYNPFSYIRQEEDIIKIIKNIQEATTPLEATKGDPFWEDGVTLYLQALFFYVYYECPKSRRNMLEILQLVNDEMEVLDDEGTTRLTLLMQNLEYGKRGKEHPAYQNYMKLKKGAPETVASIILMVNTKLQLFGIPEVRRIFEEDTLDLKELGIGKNGDKQTKSALFLVIPDSDDSFNFIISMLYTQLMDLLIYEADFHFHGALPLPVELWMDEYANGARPYRFEKLITTLRSRNISAIPIVQSISQLKTIHKGESWDILMDACSVLVFLGAGRGALNSQKYLSELLGQETIDKRTEGENRGKGGSSNLNFDRMGRDLLSTAEIGSMSGKECILLIAGHHPILDKKNKPFSLPEFLYARSLPRYVHPISVQREASGQYRTLQSEGRLVALNEESVSYYRGLKEDGEAVNFYTLTEDALLEMDFFAEEEMDLTQVSKYFLEHQKEVQELQKAAAIEDGIHQKIQGDIFSWIKNYQDLLSEEQLEEILRGLEEGLSGEEVKEYFFLPKEQMKKARRLLILQKKEAENGNG